MNAPDIIYQKLNELLSTFYAQYNLGEDGGISQPKVKIEFTRYIYFFFPNWNERCRAVERHDIHHIITGYPSTIKGEAEICTWEISSGCRNYWAAWFLNMQAMTFAWIYPRTSFKAFVRGRHSNNLYHDTIVVEQAKNLTVQELRQQLHVPDITTELKPVAGDYFLFVFWSILSSLVSLLSLVFAPVIVAYNVYVFAGMIFLPERFK